MRKKVWWSSDAKAAVGEEYKHAWNPLYDQFKKEQEGVPITYKLRKQMGELRLGVARKIAKKHKVPPGMPRLWSKGIPWGSWITSDLGSTPADKRKWSAKEKADAALEYKTFHDSLLEKYPRVQEYTRRHGYYRNIHSYYVKRDAPEYYDDLTKFTKSFLRKHKILEGTLFTWICTLDDKRDLKSSKIKVVDYGEQEGPSESEKLTLEADMAQAKADLVLAEKQLEEVLPEYIKLRNNRTELRRKIAFMERLLA